MQYLKSSRGYMMLFTLVAVVLFSILGITLISITSSGLLKNETRLSTVQANDLSEKGIDFAVSSIQNQLKSSLKDANGNFALSKDEFEQRLINILTNSALACPKTVPDVKIADFGLKIDGAIKETKTLVCIDKIEELAVDPENPEKNKYKRIVTFKSYGFSNNISKLSSTKVILGTDAIPDQLKYAVSSNDGDVYLYGGVEVTGDIKSDNNIHIFENSFAGWSYDPDWYNSVPLKLNPTVGNASGKLIFSNPNAKTYYYNKNTNNNSYHSYIYNGKSAKIKLKNFTNTLGLNNQSELKKYLTNSPKVNIVSKDIPKDKINVNDEIEQMYIKKNTIIDKKGSYAGTNKPTPSSNEIKLDKNKNDITLIYNEKCVSRDRSNKCTSYDLSEQKANLTINLQNSYNRKISIQGTYYINGDLTIHYADLKSNAILYVNGDVDIRFSTLSELEKDKSLIIFATGEIFIANISENSPSPSTIKGFFYSEKDMIMYGVGSNIKIVGGVSANNIFLTAMRGTMQTSASEQKTKNSRLHIIYDENVINHYTQFKRDKEEELVTQINDPQILERQ